MNVKKRKRFVGTICLMLSMVLLTVPMLGMAALPASAAAEEQPECICDTQCTAEHPNEACEVCMEDTEKCVGEELLPNPYTCICTEECTKELINEDCEACQYGYQQEQRKRSVKNSILLHVFFLLLRFRAKLRFH